MAKRFLIVDDSVSFRQIMCELVLSMGHEVAGEAVDGVEAVEKHKELRPDVTLLDIRMPRMVGIDALKQIIANDPEAAVVMLTSVDDIGVVDDCIMAGARDYIRKDRIDEAARRIADVL